MTDQTIEKADEDEGGYPIPERGRQYIDMAAGCVYTKAGAQLHFATWPTVLPHGLGLTSSKTAGSSKTSDVYIDYDSIDHTVRARQATPPPADAPPPPERPSTQKPGMKVAAPGEDSTAADPPQPQRPSPADIAKKVGQQLAAGGNGTPVTPTDPPVDDTESDTVDEIQRDATGAEIFPPDDE